MYASPRCPFIISRSFARIHETNLKKQGVLPLTFANEKDWELIAGGDVIETFGVKDITPRKPVQLLVTKTDGFKLTLDAKALIKSNGSKKGNVLNLIKEKVVSA